MADVYARDAEARPMRMMEELLRRDQDAKGFFQMSRGLADL